MTTTNRPLISQLFTDTRTTSIAPLPSPQLDDRSEKQLVEDAIARVRTQSREVLNDFSVGSPTRALLEGHAMIQAKMAFIANQLGRKAAIDWLQVAGVQRIAGRAATTTLVFRLTAALTTDFIVPISFEVRSTGASFITSEALVIPAGEVSGEVPAQCRSVGTIGNVGAARIDTPIRSLSFLQSVTNPLPVTNGEDGETEQETISRGFASLRRRNLITVDDYEEFVRGVIGKSAVVKAYGGIDLQGATAEQPTVIVAIAGASGDQISDAEKVQLESALGLRGHATVQHTVVDIETVSLDARVLLDLPPTAGMKTMSDKVAAALKKYVSPSSVWVDARLELNQLIYQVGEVGKQASQQTNGLYGWGVYFGRTGQALTDTLAVTNSYQTLKLSTIIIEANQQGATEIRGYGPGDPD